VRISLEIIKILFKKIKMNYKFCCFIEKKDRLDLYLTKIFTDFSRSYVQKIIDSGQVKVNSKIIKKNSKIFNTDEIDINLKTEKLDLEAENIPLDIVFEDSEIVIINKEAWINVHSVPWEWWKSGTLVNALLYHIKDLSSINGVERPGIVHRLDKNTSWLIMIAKTDKMMTYLQEVMKQRKAGKYYLAVVSGILKENEFKIESFIWRHPTNKIKMTTQNAINPKLAITHWRVIKYIDEKHTLVEMKLETGRTHQIRVHLASIWYPILWDEVYGNPKVNKEVATRYQIKRQALHSYKLEIELYWKNKTFYWELKADMKQFVEDLDLENL